jgi:hypothetical protein
MSFPDDFAIEQMSQRPFQSTLKRKLTMQWKKTFCMI